MNLFKSFFGVPSADKSPSNGSSPMRASTPCKTTPKNTPDSESEIIAEEIDIKSTILDISTKFTKESLLIWHDPNVNGQQNLPIAAALRTISDIKRFSDWEKAVRFIKETPCMCHVITSGTNGEQLVKAIHDLPNVWDISIFCGNIEFHSQWSKSYSKVLCVHNQINSFVSTINGEVCKWQREVSKLRLSFPGFQFLFDDEINKDYLALTYNFENRTQAKRDFMKLARGMSNDKRHIDEFEQNYNQYDMKLILNWYTKESFLYQVTNHCLKKITGISDAYQYCRLIIKDLSEAIKEQYRLRSMNFSGLVYKGAYFSTEEWERLQENIGKSMLIDSFLCTSKEKTKPLKFAQDDIEQHVLVTIIIPLGLNTNKQGYAELREFSDFAFEDEVMFNIFSTFTVLSAATEQYEGKEYRHLTLLYGSHEWRNYVREKNPQYEVRLPELSSLRCSACQIEVSSAKSQPLLATLTYPHQFICQGCMDTVSFNEKHPLLCIPMIGGQVSEEALSKPIKVNGIEMRYQEEFTLPFYGYKCSECKDGNFKYAYKCTECTKPQKTWCEECQTQRAKCTEEGHAIILERHPYSFWAEKMLNFEVVQDRISQGILPGQTEFQQAEEFFKAGKFTKAIQAYQDFIFMNDDADTSLIAQAFRNTGASYRNTGNYSQALIDLKEAMKIFKDLHGDINPEVASTYEELGALYSDLGNYKTAFEQYTEALKTKKSIFGYEHVSIAESYHQLGLAHELLGEAREALKDHLKALEINDSHYKGWNTVLGDSYHYVGEAYCVMGEYNKATENHKKGMEHRVQVHGESHIKVARSYEGFGMVYNASGDAQKTVESLVKALEITKDCEGEYELPAARSYELLGKVYTKQGDVENALDDHEKALEIRIGKAGENHALVGDSYEALGNAYLKANELEKAKGLFEKGLNLKIAFYNEKHQSLGECFANLGDLYKAKKEWKMAIEFYGKAVDNMKEYHGDKYPRVADCYLKIGDVKIELKEYQDAVDNHLKALEIRRAAYGDDHHETKAAFSQVGKTYLTMSESD